ncbi:phytoene desaturase family protein [Leucobacter aridicollis]|uniref:phytoene desaturase family protein n=1 Tax=Leucobacter aridicollis TaxID=283878 RepID=UPI000E653C11|nr:NAD(P)/FAD-dependent oxidoreductase [Leucobacter aridicollis]UTX52564.1 NAD(P)/FAD-dependent oxidoreductase [Leucobacter aridicollis]
MQPSLGAAVVGSGPNGLAAAVTLARAGIPVTLFEAMESLGGGARTLSHVTLGVVHDVCSAIHPMALATGFFREFELTRRMNFVVPDASYAHPLDGTAGSTAAVAYRDIERTASELGRDGAAYARLYKPLLERLDGVLDVALGGPVLRWPSDLLAAAAFGVRTLEQGTPLWDLRFREEHAPALVTGVAAHSIGRLPALTHAGVAFVLGALGHASGWPVPVGGSQAITDALAADLLMHGGRIELGRRIAHLDELAGFEVKLFDTSARGLVEIAGDALPSGYRKRLMGFRYGNAAAKLDLVLDGPIPWRDARVEQAPTVHLGGTRAEIVAAEAEVARGRHAARPYVLVAQPAGCDPGRNPGGVHAVTTYTHVPSGSTADVTETVLSQLERFAPGVRDRVSAVRMTTAAELGRENRNYVGGDFSAGQVSLRQLVARPVLGSEPWRTPTKGVYLCSSSTAPGPGVHGLAGWYAAKSALRREYGLDVPSLAFGG